jgi:predicted metal-binding protein
MNDIYLLVNKLRHKKIKLSAEDKKSCLPILTKEEEAFNQGLDQAINLLCKECKKIHDIRNDNFWKDCKHCSDKGKT